MQFNKNILLIGLDRGYIDQVNISDCKIVNNTSKFVNNTSKFKCVNNTSKVDCNQYDDDINDIQLTKRKNKLVIATFGVYIAIIYLDRYNCV